MATPFTADGRLDTAAAERLTEQLAAHGLHVFVNGTTGEGASIAFADRVKLTEIAVKVAAKRVHVYAGIGSNCFADSVETARASLKAGADAVVAQPPSYYALDGAEMQAYFEQLIAQVKGSFMIYNIPLTMHLSIPVDVVARLAELPGVIGFKDSEGTPGRIEAVSGKVGGKAGFSLFVGVAALGVTAMKHGYDGVVPSSGNLAPRLWQQFDQAALAGDWAAAEKFQQQLDVIAGILQKGRSLAQFLAAMKAALHLRGLCTPAMLPPLRAMDPAAMASLRLELGAAGVL